MGGEQPYTVITQQQFDSLNPVPTDGTLIETDTGAVYRDRRRRAAVRQRSGAVRHRAAGAGRRVGHRQRRATRRLDLNPVPSNGTFLTTTTGSNYRSPVAPRSAITTWRSFGGAQPSVTIDPWDICERLEPADPPRLPAGDRHGGRGSAVRRVLGVRAQEPLSRRAHSGRGARRRPRSRAVLGHPSAGSRASAT